MTGKNSGFGGWRGKISQTALLKLREETVVSVHPLSLSALHSTPHPQKKSSRAKRQAQQPVLGMVN